MRESFDNQRVMETIGARLARVEPGEVDIELGYDERLTQQTGYLHAGVVTAVLDSACGYAAYSLMEPGSEVLSIEFKVNLLAPAVGEKLVARASVVRAGRTITVCRAEGWMVLGGEEVQVATMTGTMMQLRGRGVEGG
ncbi:MAG TPA: PaaI family thioesterase [Gemmatimonadaceae bacterium]|nr:PaaI family thioesterase [Gemmatimonadaceae bacterium]